MRFRYRLNGEVDGRTLDFDLKDGDHRIGSSPESDVRLAFEGVSRRHALLRVLPAGVSVEDSGSRNGTFVDGSRVRKAVVGEGASLAFGPVELTLSPLDEGDAVAAILLGAPDGPDSVSALDVETPLLASSCRGAEGALLGAVEAVLERLHGPAGRARALTAVAEGCGADGAWLAHWPAAGEPAVWIAHGEPPTLPDRVRIDAAHGGREIGWLRWQCGESGSFVMVSTAEAGGRRTGLIVRNPGEPEPAPAFLRIGLRMLRRAVDSAFEMAAIRRSTPRARRRLMFPTGHVPGSGPEMDSLHAELEVALGTDLPILFLGETGVGKDQLVKVFHGSSTRAEHPLVAVNCAAIPDELFEAELFGTVRGAATGVDARLGALRRAEKGTLFLDEVGETPARHQAKLLRALQEREVQPVGGDRSVPVDLRIVAATNQDLEGQVADGTFRRDLFYRLSGHVVTLPPLRRRRADLPGLIEHFARQAVQVDGSPVLGFSVAALRGLLRYPWPGNVRELETEIHRLVAAVGAAGCPRLIDVGLLPERIRAQRDVDAAAADVAAADPGAADPGAADPGATDDLHLASRVDALERRLIRAALKRSGGRRGAAAQLLGLHRNGLRLKMNRLGLGDKPTTP